MHVHASMSLCVDKIGEVRVRLTHLLILGGGPWAGSDLRNVGDMVSLVLIRMPWLQLECSSRQVQDSTFSNSQSLVTWSVFLHITPEVFTEAIVENLNGDSFRIEDDQGNLLFGRHGVGSPIPLIHVDRHWLTTA